MRPGEPAQEMTSISDLTSIGKASNQLFNSFNFSHFSLGVKMHQLSAAVGCFPVLILSHTKRHKIKSNVEKIFGDITLFIMLTRLLFLFGTNIVPYPSGCSLARHSQRCCRKQSSFGRGMGQISQQLSVTYMLSRCLCSQALESQTDCIKCILSPKTHRRRDPVEGHFM